MFDRGMIRSIIFLLVILLVTCIMMAPMTEGFLGMPRTNAPQFFIVQKANVPHSVNYFISIPFIFKICLLKTLI